MLLTETDADGASAVAQRAIDAVEGLQILHVASRGRITLSVGGGCCGSSRPTTGNAAADSSPRGLLAAAVPDDLIAAAEQGLKSAKSAGDHRARLVDIAHLGNLQGNVI